MAEEGREKRFRVGSTNKIRKNEKANKKDNLRAELGTINGKSQRKPTSSINS
jgi:hypothetical protein